MLEEVVPVIRVEDAGPAVDWYERLGFVKEWEHQNSSPGSPGLFLSPRMMSASIFLSTEGDAPHGWR